MWLTLVLASASFLRELQVCRSLKVAFENWEFRTWEGALIGIFASAVVGIVAVWLFRWLERFRERRSQRRKGKRGSVEHRK